MAKADNVRRNRVLALTNLRRKNAMLIKALSASDRALREIQEAVLAWYENTEGDTDVPEEAGLIRIAKRLNGEK